MNVLSNKHVVAALLITPILAVLSYFAVDRWLSEKPHAAKMGSHYPLVEKSNCRYSSGRCDLRNGEFSLRLEVKKIQQSHILHIQSKHPLEGIKVAIADKDGEALNPPQNLAVADVTGNQWQLTLPTNNFSNSRLQLVASTGSSLYFGETAMVFTQDANY